jgi:hypothetical protein
MLQSQDMEDPSMPEEKDLVPRQNDIVSTGVDNGNELNEAFTQMSEQLQKAILSLQFQNVRDADMAADTTKGLYAFWSPSASPEEEILMRILKHLTCLYAPLTRILVYQAEGHFLKARSEIENGLITLRDTIAAVDEFSRLPDVDKEVIQSYRPILTIFPILFRGLDANIRAEMFGYRGDIPQYTKFLQEAVTEISPG